MDPTDLAALRGLQQVAMDLGDVDAQVAATLREVDCCPDPSVLAERLRDLENLASDGQHVARGAVQHANARLEEVLTDRECWSALRDQLASRIGADDGQHDLELHERLALLCREHLEDPGACITHLESAARLDSGRAQLWEQLASLYEERENPADLARVLEAELETAAVGERELPLRVRAARAQLASGRAEQATPHFERCLELDPEHAEALEFLIDRSRAAGDSTAVARLLETRLEAEDDTPDSRVCSVSLRLRLARVRSEQLGDRQGAIAALEPVLDLDEGVRASAEFLEPLLSDAGRADDRIRLCERAAQTSQDAQERAHWQKRLAEALRGRGEPTDLERAEEIYRASLADEPTDGAAREALRDVLRRLERAEPLAEQLEIELASEPASVCPIDPSALRMEWAELLRGPLAAPGRALEVLLELLQLEPTHREASTQALGLAEQLGQPTVQLALLDARLEASVEPQQRVRLQEARARLLTSELDRPAEAVDALREVLSLEPRRDDLRQALCAALTSLSRWPELLEELWTLASGAAAEGRDARLDELERVATRQLPSDAALPWLERLRAARPQETRLLNEIAKIHRQAGRPSALLGALEAELSLAPATERGLELQRERARILEHELDSPARAVLALEAARALAPRDTEVLSGLDRLYAAQGRLHDRAAVLEAQLEFAPEADRKARISLHRSAATVWTALLRPEPALRHRLCAVSLCEASPGAEKAEILSELTAALCRAGRPDLSARSEEAELACLTPQASTRRLELHRSLAAQYARAGTQPRAALEHLDRFFSLARQQPESEETPSDAALEWAETARLELLRANGDVVGLAACLEAKLGHNEQDADAWLELARLREEQLCAPLAASKAYREAARLRPEDRVSLRGLRGAAERLGDWREVAKTLERELELCADPDERAALLRCLGSVRSTRLGAVTGASEAYAQALELAPEHLGALRAQQELARGDERWQEELGLCERELEILGETEASRRRDVWLRIAELTRDRTDDPQGALGAYEQASRCGALPAERLREWAAHCERMGDHERHAEVFCAWCDDASTAVTDADLRFAAELLEQQGKTQEALTRVQRALALCDRDPANWDAAARLYEAQGDVESAADAVECAAQLDSGPQAALRLARAAELVVASDLARAESLLVRASEIDPAAPRISARLARIASERENWDTALRAAQRALDLSSAGAAESPAGAEEMFEAALAGGRAARAQDQLEPAARFFEAALAIVPDSAPALEGLGEALHQMGDVPAAAGALERRLQLPGQNQHRALHLAITGEGREREGNEQTALERYREALSLDPAEMLAHAGTVRIHRASGRVDDAVKALECWAESCDEAGERAQHRWCAAQLEFDSGRLENAERLLRAAVADSSSCEPAWRLLAELLDNAERGDEALEVAGRALDFVTNRVDRAALAGIRARTLAARGDEGEAADAYGTLLAADPLCTEAAIARGRLLRGLGRWDDAERALAEFAAHHPNPEEPALASVFAERARLLSGPLERLEEAVSCHERAVELDPTCATLRAELARSLTHIPGRLRDAIRLHAALLSEDPTQSESLRAVAQIAKAGSRAALRTRGLALLAALGSASPEERSEVPAAFPLCATQRARLEPVLWERLRGATLESSDALSNTLEVTSAGAQRPAGEGPVQAFVEAHRLALGQLCAPGLWTMTDAELSDALRSLCRVVFGQSPDGRFEAKLENELGVRGRRRVRRAFEGAELEDLLAIDFAKWRRALSDLAAASALTAREGDLRSALIALAAGSPDPSRGAEPPAQGVDIQKLVSGSEPAKNLLATIVGAWCSDLEAAQS